MVTRLQELRKEFLTILADALTPLRFKRRGDNFYRAQPYGKDIIEMTFVSHPGLDFEAEIFIGVRHDVVEEIVNAHCPHIPKELLKWTATVGNRLDNMTHSVDWKWKISENVDLKQEVRNLMESAVRGIALPYFERFSSLEEVLQVLSRWDDESERMEMAIDFPSAGMSAIAAAYVLENRNEFYHIFNSFLPVYKERAEQGNFVYESGLPEFLALADDLKKRWAEQEAVD